jgi:hypothetical protein
MTKKTTRPGLDRTGDNTVKFRRNSFRDHLAHNLIAKSVIGILTIILAVPAIFAAEEPTAKPAEKPDFTLTKLKFENAKGICDNFTYTMRKDMSHSSATHVARFNIVDLEAYTNFTRTDGWKSRYGSTIRSFYFLRELENEILSTPTGKKLSSEQKELISNGRVMAMPQTGSDIANLYVLGVDKEQAKNTAVAFMEYLNGSAEKKYRSAEKSLRHNEKQYQELSNEEQAWKKKLDAAKEKFEAHKRGTHYQNDEAALKAIERMNVIYETKTIELHVLIAKRDAVNISLDNEEAIKAGNPEKYDRQTILLKLEELRVDISIALAEVQATLRAAAGIRENAERFIQYRDEYGVISEEHHDIIDEIEKVNKRLQSFKERMDNPPKSYLPPKVIDNKITLQPLKVSEDTRAKAHDHADQSSH